MKKILFLFLLVKSWGITNVTLPYVIDTASIPKVRYVDKNDSALKWGVNNLGDTLNAATGTGLIVRRGSPTITGTPIFSGLTASLPVFTDASKGLTSNAMTGTGSVVMSASPSGTGTWTLPIVNVSGKATFSDSIVGVSQRLTGNLTAANGAFSGTLGVTGAATLSSSLGVASDLTVNSSKFYVEGASGRVGIGNTGSTDGWLYMSGASGLVAGVNNYGLVGFPVFQSNATNSGAVAWLGLKTAAAAYTMVNGYALHIETPSLGAGSAVTTNYAVKVENQTGPGTNYAWYSGTGLFRVGDAATFIAKVSGSDTIAADLGFRAGATAASNVNLYRSAANMWKTDDSMTVAGSVTATGGLTLGASFNDKTTTVTAGTTTLSSSHSVIFANATGGDVTLNLPTASGIAGRTYKIVKIDITSNVVNLTPNGSETIDGFIPPNSHFVLIGNQGSSAVTLVSDGTNWHSLDWHDDGSFTSTYTGMTTTVQGISYFSRNGWSLTVHIVGTTGTSNSTSFTITGLPAGIRPSYATATVAVEGVEDNGNIYSGRFQITSGGTINPFFRTSATAIGNTYTNSGTKGIAYDNNVTYALD